MIRTLYDILGVSPGASYAEIRDAYHCKLNSITVAPDEHTVDNEPHEASAELRWLTRAWEVLGSPRGRKRYDQQLRESFLRAACSLTDSIPAHIQSQTCRAHGFYCTHCAYSDDARSLPHCPICGMPAKTVWAPRWRLLRWLGLTPWIARGANRFAHGWRELARVGHRFRRIATSTTFLAIVGTVIVLVALGVCTYYLSEPEDPLWSAQDTMNFEAP